MKKIKQNLIIIICILLVIGMHLINNLQVVQDKWIEPRDTIKVLVEFKVNDSICLVERRVIDKLDYVIIAQNRVFKTYHYVDSAFWRSKQPGDLIYRVIGSNDKSLKRLFKKN